MADLTSGASAKIQLDPGQSLRVEAEGGTTSVTSLYGAPAGTTAVTGSTTFGPYSVPAMLRVVCASGACSYATVRDEPAANALTAPQVTALQAVVSKDGKLARFHNKLAARNYAPVNILNVGDSHAEGYGASALSRRYAAQLVKRLRQAFPMDSGAGGFGFMPSVWYAAGFTGTTTYTGSYILQTNLGPAGRTIRLNNASSVTFKNVTGSTFKVLYAGSSGTGVASVTVGGVAAADLNTNTGVALQADVLGTTAYTITGTAQDVVIAWKSGGSVFVEGIMIFDGDESTGIRIWEAAVSGTETQYLQRSPLSSGYIPIIAPDLVLMNITANDYKNVRTLEQVTTNITAYMAAIRAAAGYTVPFAFELMPERNDMSGITPTASWPEFVAAIKAIVDADADSVISSDLFAAYGTIASAGTGLFPDNIHGNDSVHAMRAEKVLARIRP